MNTLIAVFLGIGFAVLIFFIIKGRNKKSADGIDWGKVVPGDVPMFTVKTGQTPLGISIYSDTPFTQEELAELDRAYTEEVAIAERDGGYTVFPHPSVIDVYLPKSGCAPSPEWGVLSFKLRYGADYDATIYDTHYSKKYDPPKKEVLDNGIEVLLYSKKDGIAVGYAGEMVLSLSTPGSTPPRDAFILCRGNLYNGMRAGLNHVFIAHNDGYYFSQTIGPDHTHQIPYRRIAGLAGAVSYTCTKPIPIYCK